MKRVTFDENDIRKLISLDSRAQRFWRLFWRTVRQLTYLAILFVVFFLVLNYAAYWQRFHYTITAKPVEKVAVTPPAPAVPLPDYLPEVDIPKIGVSAPLLVNVSNSDILTQLQLGIVQYLDSALPGQTGNMVLVGHSSNWPWIKSNYNTIFALIDQLKVGDQIIIPYHTQKYIYEVTETKVVKPNDLSVLNRTDTPTLTLLTCYPVGTTNSRYIVLAKLVTDNASGTQTTEPNTTAVPSPR